MTDVRVNRERDEQQGWGYGDYGISARKRKAYDRDYDQGFDEGRYRGDRGGGWGYNRGLGFGLDPFNYLDVYGPSGRRGLGYGFNYPDFTAALGAPALGFPSSVYRPQNIGDAGYDLGLSRRRGVPEEKYRQLPDYSRVTDNPAIDEDTLWRPRADIFEQDNGLRVEFELPGVPRDDISLTVTENAITLTALKPQTRKEEVGFHFQNERHFGKFYRRLALPYDVDPTSVRAHLDHGVLKVTFTRGTGAGRVPISVGEQGTSTAATSTPSTAAT